MHEHVQTGLDGIADGGPDSVTAQPLGESGDLSAATPQQPRVKTGNTLFAGVHVQSPGAIYIGPKGIRPADPDAWFKTVHYPSKPA